MRCPTSSELPPPPPGKTGWPWTVETSSISATMPNEVSYPKISIVTPSYNQGEFIEETIRSVLLQNYPNLEYIVMDGGSTDNTISILEKYSHWISLWRSEKDNGQTHAINKGFDSASGSLLGYLNSDDVLLPKSLEQVAHLTATYPEEAILILGNCEMGYSLEEIFNVCVPVPPSSFVDALSKDGLCPQPATFWTKPTRSAPKRFNENLVFCMDYDFWVQLILAGYKVISLDVSLAFYRHHVNAKGSKLTNVMWSELAGLPLLRLTEAKSFEDKLYLTSISKRRIRHYLRLEIENISSISGKWAALRSLARAFLSDPIFLFERSTLGLVRKLLVSYRDPKGVTRGEAGTSHPLGTESPNPSWFSYK